MKRNYGIPYMGSKNRIAKNIIDFLPAGETLVDLFGGGGAITDCANESNKWQHIIYNELNELPYKCFLKALRGEYENEDRWISKQDFTKLKDTDEYVACCFSFGNNFRNYMYNEKIESYKRAYHYAIVLDDFQPLSELFDKNVVDSLQKSVEGEINKKQRRLKFTKALGNYIIGLKGERLENLERKERLDELKQEQVDNITFFNKDYRDVHIPNNAVIYCDIPYKNTGTYNKEAFDYERFYSWCEEKGRQGYKVYISEYTMPEDRFECVKEIKSASCFAQTKTSKVIEKIFVPKL